MFYLLLIGPSIEKREEINPMEKSPLNSFMFPSFILISTTDDNLPPKRAGKPPLYNFTVLIADGLKTEKKPKMTCVINRNPVE